MADPGAWDAAHDTQGVHARQGMCACGAKAVYYRRWEGQYYCSSCLARQVEKRFRRTVREGKLIEKNERIAVALSGGKDSSVLAHLLGKLRKDLPFELVAISVDEGIESYRPETLAKAKELAARLGIEWHGVSFKDMFDVSIDTLDKKKHCTYCGVFRRAALNRKAKELGVAKVAVGHNLDDEAQSILMNVVRGDVARFQRLGTAAGNERLVPRIKPLRDMPEREVMLYALIKRIPFSGIECPNSFDNVRRDVQDQLNILEEKYPGTKQQVVSFYDRVRPLVLAKGMPLGTCMQCGEPAAGKICRACELRAEAAR